MRQIIHFVATCYNKLVQLSVNATLFESAAAGAMVVEDAVSAEAVPC